MEHLGSRLSAVLMRWGDVKLGAEFPAALIFSSWLNNTVSVLRKELLMVACMLYMPLSPSSLTEIRDNCTMCIGNQNPRCREDIKLTNSGSAHDARELPVKHCNTELLWL